MNPEYEHKIPTTPEDLHTNEDRLGPNPWDTPATSASAPLVSPSLPPIGTARPAGTAYPIPAATIEPKKAKKHVPKLVVAIVSIGFMVTGSFQLYQTFYADRVSTSDLVTTTSPGGSFLRPKQWTQVNSTANKVIYGNELGKDHKSSALVAVVDDKSSTQALTTYSSTDIATVRDVLIKQITPEFLEKTFSDTNGCSSVTNINNTVGTTATDQSVDITHTTFDCQRADGTAKTALNISADNNGYTHIIMLLAYQDNWAKNQEAYNKILTSVKSRGDITWTHSSALNTNL